MEGLLSLNQRRWDARVTHQRRARDAATAGSAATAGKPALPSLPYLMPAATVPTSGPVFFRRPPIRGDGPHAGKYEPLANRKHYTNGGKRNPENQKFYDNESFPGRPSFIDPRDSNKEVPYTNEDEFQRLRDRSVGYGGKELIMVFNHNDWTGVSVTDPDRYRIPNTSVTNREGDCGFFCGLGPRLTGAQWIWLFNLVCFVAHFVHAMLVLHFAYWRHGMNPMNSKDAARMLVRVYRVTGIPTQQMIDNNLTDWEPGERWSNDFYLRDNGMPINFASLTFSFFMVSAVFHLWAVIFGIHERTWFWYWRQMDDAFCYWRWAEYSLSASLMALAIALSLGIREQNALAGIFMLHWSTMWFGFLVEYVSVPKYKMDTVTYKVPSGVAEVQAFAQDGRQDFPVEYADEHLGRNALKLIDQYEWEGDRPSRDLRAYSANSGVPASAEASAATGAVVKTSKYPWSNIQGQKCRNYIRRMVPHVLGWFPISAAWVMMIHQLDLASDDLAAVSDVRIPDWVLGAIWGTIIIFWSFTIVQIIFQKLNPAHYWGTELIFCALSLSAKLYLGWFLMINVVMTDGAENALGGVNPDHHHD